MCQPNFENPAEWTYAGGVLNYSSGSDLEAEIADMMLGDFEDIHNTTGKYSWLTGKQARDLVDPDSRFATKGTCDHCGAAFKFGAMFQNASGQSAVVGHICAVNTLTLSASEIVLRGMKQQAKAIRTRAKGDARLAALAPNRLAAMEHDHHINRDMRSRFRKWGSLSVKQWALAKKIQRESVERETKREEERKNLVPVVEGKGVEIEGEVLTCKWQEGGHYYADAVLKLLIMDARGFKVWGSCPGALSDQVERGCVVKLVANVEQSKDDPTFGFFKRPRKGEVVKTTA